MEKVKAELEADLIYFLKKRGFSINGNALNILMNAEEMCYKRNMAFFPSDLLLPLITMYADFAKIIDKYGGNSILAIKDIKRSLDNDSNFKVRDPYFVDNYSVKENSNYRYLIIDKCIKNANNNNRAEISEAEIILSVLALHEEEFPVVTNGTIKDIKFHTPFNTLSHIILESSENLWVKFDDIRWELSNYNKRKYDIALSFAGEDRKIAEDIAELLTNLGKRVFYDNFEKSNLWGKDLYAYLSEIYGERAKYCLMIVSKSYAKEHWPNFERQAAQAKALKENQEYILPLRLDDTEVPGLLPTTGYIDFRNTTTSEIVNLIIKKISDNSI
ncbi:toll/interleukin-1 receptor domain-containing protein [Bacillus safensis]|uniref:toll/interleukin-1 receptor domain-containing protein n=1 Tax=Bacillus safensis TaxID=561879 RepID=UPI0022AB6465|nr:TIR domain-containing protein [Bacillus safensis]WAT80761.1 TIR domain-containing protein [Bacillus safensis]